MPARRRAPLRCASPWGWPRRSLALGRFASVEARVRVPIRRAMSLYPQDPVRPVCAGALGCGVCGGSECVECPAVPPSSVQFLPVLASSGGFVKSCGEFLAVCASARECLEFATVPAGLYRCFSSSHSVPALTGVDVKFWPVHVILAQYYLYSFAYILPGPSIFSRIFLKWLLISLHPYPVYSPLPRFSVTR